MRIALVTAALACFAALLIAQQPSSLPATAPAAGPATTSAPTTAPADVLFMVTQGRRVGWIDRNGKTIIDLKFGNDPTAGASIEDFHEGLARVMIDKKWGYIDRTGKLAIEPQFEFAERFSHGLAPVKKGGKYGYINARGEFKIGAQFDAAWPFAEGLAMFQQVRRDQNNKRLFGFVDVRGVTVIEPQEFDDVGYYFSDGRFRFRKGEKHGFIDRAGKIVIEPKFETAMNFVDGVAPAAEKRGQMGLIDKKGDWVVKPEHLVVGTLSEGLIPFLPKGGKLWGYMDKTGKVLIEPQFSFAGAFSEGLAAVYSTPAMLGNVIVKFPRGGYIDKTGKLVIQIQFMECSPFRNGLAQVLLDGRKVAYIDPQGNFVWKAE